jgi:hypothetical protein
MWTKWTEWTVNERKASSPRFSTVHPVHRVHVVRFWQQSLMPS